MDLADELLNDLDGDSDLDDDTNEIDHDCFKLPSLPASAALKRKSTGKDAVKEEDDSEDEIDGDHEAMGIDLPAGGVAPTEEVDVDDVKKMDLIDVADVGTVAKLWSSRTLKDVVAKIRHYTEHPSGETVMSNDSPEYRLIVQANNLAVEIDNEVMVVHKYIRDHYAPRFPNLERLLPNPYEYLRAVRLFGNSQQLSSVRGFENVLSSATAMIVTVEAATASGDRMLTELEWSRVDKAVAVAEELEDARKQILEYVESRMSLMAPNLSAIVGTRTAAKLMGVAGGLSGLSKMPSCNVHLLGAQKKNLATGFSTAHSSHSQQRLHTGFIYQCELVRNTEEQFKMKAQRTIGAKCVLATRMDHSRQFLDGSYGSKLKEEIQLKLEKLAEPPPQKLTKALPVPSEGPKKRRGGKRARKAKEAHAQTELKKLTNRLRFGEAEEEIGSYDETKGLGMLGGSTGKVRLNNGEIRSKAKLSKANKNRLAALRSSGSSSQGGSNQSGLNSGISSSLTFTPVQGLELVDPAAQQRSKQANLEAVKPSWFVEGRFSVVPGSKSKEGSILK
ncbi:U4/U6 small nuclear ribonucleoprotein Prp31 [Phakopsora pachyrhizi]|uniref:U4/U6 small nuclear ribonucleo protein Prp31 n=1 Tax=Phakopsora pachyrhizi TaxID=170000 RepID=A0AAV0ASF4_PHAPC|nr:U4/U6 small nuclear ribonucleoprotein Prp31 [Phakopsora pachyrhizi]CAH7671402.1 U4/U6 small nuclear ribonucleo protein Prp31 [Phakopsora pachyrhizi]